MPVDNFIAEATKRGFEAEYFESGDALVRALKDFVRPDWTVGFGGSLTLRQLGIPATLKEMGIDTLDHWDESLTKEQEWDFRLRQGRCDLFMTSVNAATADGRLVLVDGVGNRVAAAIFGPKTVIHVLGENKIMKDMHSAIARIRNFAAPKRSESLGLKNPCIETGQCQDCRSPKRICRARVTLEGAPWGTTSKVWVVKGNYGY